MTFGERLTDLRISKGYKTRNEFADALGIPSTTLRNYETDVREPGHTFLVQVSQLLNVSIDYLLGISTDKEIMSEHNIRTSEYEHITKYRVLDTHGKDMVDTVLDKEYDRVCESTVEYDRFEPIAAHQRTDVEVTDEMIQHDNDLMDNFDNF